MVLALIVAHPTFNERVERKEGEEDPGNDDTRNENVPRDGVMECVGLDRRRHTYKTIEPTHVPVRLRSSRNLSRRIWTVKPDGVNRSNRSQECSDTEDNEEESASFCHVDGHQWIADDVFFCASRARILSVLLVPDQHQVDCDQSQEDSWQQKNVNRKDSGDEGCSWERPAESK